VSEEGERLLKFAASEATERDVRITAVATSPPQARSFAAKVRP